MKEAHPILPNRVQQAFCNIPNPGEDLVNPHNRGSDPEQVAQVYRGRHWQDLDTLLLIQHPDAPIFLSQRAFQFFLPGFLLLVIRNAQSMDQGLYSLLSCLAEAGDGSGRLDGLTEEQLLVTLDVLATTQPIEPDPSFWDFEHAIKGVLDQLAKIKPS